MQFRGYCAAQGLCEEIDKDRLEKVLLQIDLNILEQRVGPIMLVSRIHESLRVYLAASHVYNRWERGEHSYLRYFGSEHCQHRYSTSTHGGRVNGFFANQRLPGDIREVESFLSAE